MTTIKITNLKLRAIIGINDWERTELQDIIVNIAFDYDASKAIQKDDIRNAVDYKKITKKIIARTELSKFFLLEKLAATILNIVMEEPLVHKATVRVDKPLALRFADSVSAEISKERKK